MADENQGEEQNPGSTTPSGDESTSIPKFKSAEDRDKAYVELEKLATATAQELAATKQQLQDFSATVAYKPQPAAQPNPQDFTDVYKSEADLKKFWEEFAVKPQQVFGQWAAQTMQQMENRINQRDAARDAVSDFKAKHRDLAPYDDIVSIFVSKQPANLSAREKLERAAPEARKMIASIATGNKAGSNSGIDANTFVESPSGSREVGASQASAKHQDEDVVAEYIREQSSAMAKKQTPPRLK